MNYRIVMGMLVVVIITAAIFLFGNLIGDVIVETKAAEPVKQLEYVPIGNTVVRTDDLEKGVSCYYFQGWYRALSCVKVKP